MKISHLNRTLQYVFLFSLLRPSLNFQADFLKTAQGSFMEIWKNATDEGRCILKYISFVQKKGALGDPLRRHESY